MTTRLVVGLIIHMLCCFNSVLFYFADAYPTVSVRLVGGFSDSEGRVEVNYEGTWGTVCNDSFWDLNEATVLCRMLGYSTVYAYHISYAPGTGTVWMSDVDCTGNENSISECPHIGWGETSCSHTHDAGLYCSSEICMPLKNSTFIFHIQVLLLIITVMQILSVKHCVN